MATTSSASLTTLRLGGMASGMDTESIIKVMLQSKQQQIDVLEKKATDDADLYGIWNQVDTTVSMLKVNAANLTSYTNWTQKALVSNDTAIVSGTVSAYSGAEVGTYSMVVDHLATAHRYNSDAQTDTTTALGWAGVFSVNGQNITVDITDSLTAIKDKLNTVSTASGVKSYLVGTKLVMESTQTGIGHNMTLASVSGDDILTNLGVFNPGNEQTAVDLAATINGIGVSSSSNTGITSFITGTTLNFTNAGTTTISVKRDTDTIKSLLNEFITSYNDTMTYMDEQTSNSVHDGSSSNVAGALQGDTIAYNVKNKSRNILTQINTNPAQMNQSYNSLEKIGIWTTGQENRLSLVDEQKLDDALANHFDEVMTLIRSYGDSNGNGKGILRQFEDFTDGLTDPINGSITVRENNLDSQITTNQNKVAKMKVDLVNYEAELWSHFAVMESAVSKINSQGNYVMSSLGQSGK